MPPRTIGLDPGFEPLEGCFKSLICTSQMWPISRVDFGCQEHPLIYSCDCGHPLTIGALDGWETIQLDKAIQRDYGANLQIGTYQLRTHKHIVLGIYSDGASGAAGGGLMIVWRVSQRFLTSSLIAARTAAILGAARATSLGATALDTGLGGAAAIGLINGVLYHYKVLVKSDVRPAGACVLRCTA